MLGPILFNIFINDLFLFVKDVELANFVDASTTYASIEKLIKVLGRESTSAIDWFRTNDVIVNLDKFQAMIMSCDKKRKQT